MLGADLGSTGVDGVFLGATCAAVIAFQRQNGLTEDGTVGAATWSALVDATFTLGDRLLYLRLPYLHGADVGSLQHALNALGFSCGMVDGIFGAFTERAVRDFQSNAGVDSDGIVGPDTVRAIGNLRHAWVDKPSVPPVELRTAPARRASVLTRTPVTIEAEAGSEELAGRLVNLALASEPAARLGVGALAETPRPGLTLTLHPFAADGAVVSAGEGGEDLTRRVAAAIASSKGPERRVHIVLDGPAGEEHAVQSLAVALLDGLCIGLAALEGPVVP